MMVCHTPGLRQKSETEVWGSMLVDEKGAAILVPIM